MWNDSISSKLQELRDKITKAKHVAESVCILIDDIGSEVEWELIFGSLIGRATRKEIKIFKPSK
jgi:hypothetical protein